MKFHTAVLALSLAVSGAAASAQAAPALADPNTVVTVMQFSARSAAAGEVGEVNPGTFAPVMR